MIDVSDFSEKQERFFYDLLSIQEKEKAKRFRFEKDRKEYIIAHGVLRDYVSKFLNISNPQIQFEFGAHGKPYLKDFSKFSFNLSHSKGKIALAFSKDEAEVGVDIEKIDQAFDYQLLVDRFFTKSEKRRIDSVMKFYKFWTRKESLLKLTGIGVSEVLTEIDVSRNNNLNRIQDKKLAAYLGYSIFIKSFFWKESAVSISMFDSDFEIHTFDI